MKPTVNGLEIHC